ncbi:hypothetical protein LGL08_15460 [Clostridium estertheticum]|uniref:hypothetical protein n=1 Tax=Clostridium estertheticum TaxID=238834 RepID=UPI001CF27EE1|nr:hypothetical protein [Clostridium estertheticum]MCB2307435.1 hypothetical protein [Clostridium estertheticum]MCB2345692.1 hypothetical protein [Clostridium estertheticum]MCB2350924.1 hypothetical protein [Clostridium estertheticum]WAG44092.1 hypothetical protein LL127_10860 [Clostridium estertheticum]
MYSGSKYDVAIIVICLIIIAFVSTMMRSEIEKSKTKIRDGIITVLIKYKKVESLTFWNMRKASLF